MVCVALEIKDPEKQNQNRPLSQYCWLGLFLSVPSLGELSVENLQNMAFLLLLKWDLTILPYFETWTWLVILCSHKEINE